MVSKTIGRLSVLAQLSVAFFGLGVGSAAYAVGDVVISQVYGGGGNTGAPLRNDFVELFNRSASPVDITGWSVQYASATGTGNFSGNAIATLSGVVQPGQYYLVQLASNGAVGSVLPTPDASGTQNLSGTNGKVALVNSSAGLACNGGSTPCTPAQLAQIIDLVGYGSANFFEGSPAGVLTNTTAALRLSAGCTDSDTNSADFTTGNPVPRNSASPLNPCVPGNPPVVPACPANVAVTAGLGALANLSASDADGFIGSATMIVSPSVPGINLINVVPGARLTAQLEVAAIVAVGNHSAEVSFANTDAVPQVASCTIAVNVASPAASVRIRDIQGAAHISPRNGQSVSSVPGVVTAVRTNGFYMQDPSPDGDPATSEGIFVFTSSAPTVSAGDSVQVSGTVAEFRAGGSDGLDNLTLTEITGPTITTVSNGNSLPAPVLVGTGPVAPGERSIPVDVIDDDASGSVETSGAFDAQLDGIDFYESLEGMRVQINTPVAAGPRNSFGEIPVLADNGSGAGLRTGRGGILVRATDFNPERIFLDDILAPTPSVNVGDAAPVAVGVMDYSFGNFKLLVTSTPAFTSSGLAREITSAASSDQLTIASFNVENLRPADPPAKFSTLASQIIVSLRAPDIIGVMEMQDNNGATNDTVVDATQTFNALIAAITAAGGPGYQFRQINPVDDQDGGEPGGNIRVGFLFNPQHVTFIDRPGGTSTSTISVVAGLYGPQLSASPGRVAPTHAAFAASRKPLAGEFLFNGRKLFVIANHFNSKGGDQPLFGHAQPPVRSSEIQRTQQATVLATFVQSLRSADPNANVVVLGDLNDFQFSDTLTILKSGGLVDLVETLPESERYTYVFEGNSQALDHILLSDALAAIAMPQYDVVHVNSEFANQASDHDPEVARLLLPLIEVTSQFSVQRSGLILNRATQTFNGTVQLSNTSGTAIAGPFMLAFEGLPAGVTLANASGSRNGVPYITVPLASIAAGAQTQLTVQFSNPARVSITYTLRTYSGQF